MAVRGYDQQSNGKAALLAGMAASAYAGFLIGASIV